MKTTPRVSVVPTSYNHEKHIEYSIRSILNQTFDDFELVVVDDCSTDSSWRIIQGLASLDKRVHTYRNERNMCCGVSKRRCPRFVAS